MPQSYRSRYLDDRIRSEGLIHIHIDISLVFNQYIIHILVGIPIAFRDRIVIAKFVHPAFAQSVFGLVSRSRLGHMSRSRRAWYPSRIRSVYRKYFGNHVLVVSRSWSGLVRRSFSQSGCGLVSRSVSRSFIPVVSGRYLDPNPYRGSWKKNLDGFSARLFPIFRYKIALSLQCRAHFAKGYSSLSNAWSKQPIRFPKIYGCSLGGLRYTSYSSSWSCPVVVKSSVPVIRSIGIWVDFPVVS